MPSMYDDIEEFHEHVLNLEKPIQVGLISDEFILERLRFLDEELDEFGEAGIKGNIVGVADALADIVYVALGTAWQMGLPFQDIWNVVHNANMKKVRGVTKRGNKNDAAKPPGWQSPEPAIAAILLRKIDNE